MPLAEELYEKLLEQGTFPRLDPENKGLLWAELQQPRPRLTHRKIQAHLLAVYIDHLHLVHIAPEKPPCWKAAFLRKISYQLETVNLGFEALDKQFEIDWMGKPSLWYLQLPWSRLIDTHSWGLKLTTIIHPDVADILRLPPVAKYPPLPDPMKRKLDVMSLKWYEEFVQNRGIGTTISVAHTESSPRDVESREISISGCKMRLYLPRYGTEGEASDRRLLPVVILVPGGMR